MTEDRRRRYLANAWLFLSSVLCPPSSQILLAIALHRPPNLTRGRCFHLLLVSTKTFFLGFTVLMAGLLAGFRIVG